MIETKKKCSTCKRTKNLELFSKREGSSTGHDSQCKLCQKKYRAENVDAERARSLAWDTANPERRLERALRYYDNNKEDICERRRIARAKKNKAKTEANEKYKKKITVEIFKLKLDGLTLGEISETLVEKGYQTGTSYSTIRRILREL